MSVTSFSLFDDAKILLFLDMNKYFERKSLKFNTFMQFDSIIYEGFNNYKGSPN